MRAYQIESRCGLYEWPLFPLRDRVGCYYVAARKFLRARAAKNGLVRTGLKFVVRCGVYECPHWAESDIRPTKLKVLEGLTLTVVKLLAIGNNRVKKSPKRCASEDSEMSVLQEERTSGTGVCINAFSTNTINCLGKKMNKNK